MTETETFDAIVVGASVAGCTAAAFLGRRGLKVALLERASAHDAYKKVCTHFIQPCATATIQRLGLAEPLEAAGAVRNSVDACSSFGWVPSSIDEYGYNVRRETLDPMLRDLAAKTPGVSLRLGTAVKGLVKDGERVVGVTTDAKELRAQIVVAADGRHSKLAEMANVPAKASPNERFCYLAYYRLPLETKTSIIWFCNPDVCYLFPNDGGVACLAAMPTKEKLPAFRKDVEGNFKRMFAGLPRGPNLDVAERVSEFHGMLEMPNHIRRASAKGIAFVGDAAMASDPVMGVGVGWAFQSAEWLADDVAEALLAKRGVDEALEVYARHHDERLRQHHEMINDISKGEPFNFIEKLLFGASARDESFAAGFARFNSRLVHPRDVVGPGLLARAAWIFYTRKARLPATIPPRVFA